MARVALSLVFFVSFFFVRLTKAEVIGSAPGGFKIQISEEAAATPQQVYRALTEGISKWWDKSHTYSGDASNLYLEAEPKGWFGEKLPQGGFVRHLEVVYVAPGKSIRLLGGLGPLQGMGVNGAMTIELVGQGNDKTEIRLLYIVHGFDPNGLEPIAEPVNRVLTEQLQNLKAFVESSEP